MGEWGDSFTFAGLPFFFFSACHLITSSSESPSLPLPNFSVVCAGQAVGRSVSQWRVGEVRAVARQA